MNRCHRPSTPVGTTLQRKIFWPSVRFPTLRECRGYFFGSVPCQRSLEHSQGHGVGAPFLLLEKTMTRYTIAVLVGSLRRESFNRRLAHAMAMLAPSDFTFEQVQIDDLPPYNQDDDAHQATSVLRVKAEIQKAYGLLFITPEYNRSIPGVLKNAIDH